MREGLADPVPARHRRAGGDRDLLVLRADLPWDVGGVPASTFVVMFITLWLLIWAVANGPLQIVLLRWRYRGGCFMRW